MAVHGRILIDYQLSLIITLMWSSVLNVLVKELLNLRSTRIRHSLSAGSIRTTGPYRSVHRGWEGASSDRAARSARGARQSRGLSAFPVCLVGHRCVSVSRTGFMYVLVYTCTKLRIRNTSRLLIAVVCALGRCSRTLRRRRIPGDCWRILWPARAEERAVGPDR